MVDLFKQHKYKILIFVLVVIGIVVYKYYNPYNYDFFPKCPFRTLTGLYCPGCGSQRAIHYLLNLDILNSLKENFMVVTFIPYIIVGWGFDFAKTLSPRMLAIRNRFYGTKAIMFILYLVIGFWVIRNVLLLVK